MINPNFVYLGAAFASVGIGLYAIEMIRGRAQPNRVSWLLWGTIPLITFAASVSEGAGKTAVLTLVLAITDLSIFVLSFFIKNSYWKTSRLDLACGALSLLAVALWAVTRVGTVAIVLTIAADFLACAPTVIKSYREPESEHALTYALSGVGAFITVLTISSWTLADSAFAVYLLAIDIGFVLVITVLHRRPAPAAEPVVTQADAQK